ncbi:MAG: NAD(+)/NADH kinase [Bacteroidales bacterium]|nr:NAD(+)/NADH kinase [Bacteroidales bacterium]
MNIALYYRHIASPDEVLLHTLLQALHDQHVSTTIVSEGGSVSDFDMLLSIGGDGTLLSTLQFARGGAVLPPVLGINFGHLGFLTAAPKEGVVAMVEHLVKSDYTIENRTLLHWEMINQAATAHESMPQYALNEVFLHRVESHSLLQVRVNVNGEYVADYEGDGVIVATPTGSTAYSLSCGGPILTPDSHTFIITPIAPHTLTLRPIIISDTATIHLEASSGNATLGIDSKRLPLNAPTTLQLAKAHTLLRLVRLGGQNFFSAIREKLMWGTGIRPA